MVVVTGSRRLPVALDRELVYVSDIRRVEPFVSLPSPSVVHSNTSCYQTFSFLGIRPFNERSLSLVTDLLVAGFIKLSLSAEQLF